MNKKLTDINFLLDRSGSMCSKHDDVVGGYKHFVQEQQEVVGDCTFTLIQFDSQDPYEVIYDHVPIDSVSSDLKFIPRGGTPLLDALGMSIAKTGERLAKMKEEDRPANVIFVVFTDGYENSSREYTRQQIRKIVTHQESVYKWDFVFMGADIDAIAEGGSIGFNRSSTIDFSAEKTQSAMIMSSEHIKRYRMSGDKTCLNYSDQERKELQ